MFVLLCTAAVASMMSAPAAPAPGTAEFYAVLPESVYCVEAETGMVLFEQNADLRRPPASMIKMMMMLVVDEGVMSGKWSYDQKIQISRLAESMGGTQVYVRTGDSHTLGELMAAVAVASANDAAMAVAEGLWGGKEAYLKAMNARARELGMKDSEFNSVHGLPPSKGESFDLTTARDMAVLGRECVKHPNILKWTSMRELVFRESDGMKQSTNKLLGVVPGCDGIKTGFIHAAGFCITATALRDGVRVIAVVMGDTKRGRFKSAEEALEKAFTMVRRVRPLSPGMVVGNPVPVPNGMSPSVALVARDPLEAVVKNEDAAKLQLEVTVPTTLKAPVPAGAEVGRVKLVLNGQVFGESIVLTANAIEAKGFWRRAGEKIGIL